jgi:hypothetical protein
MTTESALFPLTDQSSRRGSVDVSDIIIGDADETAAFINRLVWNALTTGALISDGYSEDGFVSVARF